ncbi:hypothetical protein [Aliihoeflea sp. 2WW]|uniref:hypothetical protein n=1 Tax=Aliihoeflea sp. 2WW TaxID=1381123 RepID=UPI0004661A00|nr:hypothetical protein [Aliihoeflea sp. 2WW]
MAATKEFIKAVHVDRAARSAEAVARAKAEGETTVGNAMTVISDMALPGLRLINANGVATWAVKTERFTKTLGYIYPKHNRPLTAPEKARELGGRIKALLKTDPDIIDEYLALYHSGYGHDDALAKIRDTSMDGRLFKDCIDQMILDRTAEGAEKPLRPSSEKDIRTTFKKPEFAEIMETPISALTRSDIEKARNDIRKRSGISPAKKAIAWTRSVFAWTLKYHSDAGLDIRDTWWEMLHAPYKVTAKTRKPEIADIVKSLIIAEEYLEKPLPGRSIDKAGVGAGVLSGLWWIVMTVQRGDAALSLKTYNLLPDENRGNGWRIAAWEDSLMKGGKAQMLPIPPRAAAHIENIRTKAKHHGSKQWAFPSDRDADKHATVSGVYRVLYRLAGRDTVEQKKPEGWEPRLKKDGTPKKLPVRTDSRDLFEENGIAWWSGHDVRRRLQTVLDDAGIPGGASVILAHEVKSNVDLDVSMTQQQREDFMRQRQARITGQAYGGAQFLKLKSEGMEVWTNALLDEYERQKSATA